MSSHHIVRENQEPALLVANFQALSAEDLGQLLEWSPTVVTNEATIDFLLAQAIKVDVLFTNSKPVLGQEKIKLVPIEGEFMEDALKYLILNRYSAVNIMASQLYPNLLKFAEGLNMVLFCQDIRYVCVKNVFEKWKPAAERVFVDADLLKASDGLRMLAPGVFETLATGFYKLEFNTPDFVWVGESF